MGSVIINRKGYFTDWDIANKFKYHHQYLGRVRNEGEKKNLIKRIGKEGFKLKFTLTETGKKVLSTGP